MTRKEFINYIESIGFKYNGWYFVYNKYKIDLYNVEYSFYNGSEWFGYVYNDLRPLNQIERSYKFKKILG